MHAQHADRGLLATYHALISFFLSSHKVTVTPRDAAQDRVLTQRVLAINPYVSSDVRSIPGCSKTLVVLQKSGCTRVPLLGVQYLGTCCGSRPH